MRDVNDFMECADWYCSRGFGWQDSKLTHDDVYAIMTRLREAEKDAARYRFMRDMSDEVDVSRFFHVDVSERDAEIDQAMKGKGDE